MIVKLHSAGKSFKTLSGYLLHDLDKALTNERVAWTHTLNCANDLPLAAVDEMYWTYVNADLLKEEAGVHAGGRRLQDAVKHASFGWHVEETPSAEEMIAAVEAFLKEMGWQDHQALLVAHDDTRHKHVHVMLNAVHPETGRKLDDGFERGRAQLWAHAYEKARGRIYCEQRELEPRQRVRSPNRREWMALREHEAAHEVAERKRRDGDLDDDPRDWSPAAVNDREWKLLKKAQQNEREAFFAEGKPLFGTIRKEVYRAVREQFRAEWGALYAALRDDLEPYRIRLFKTDLLRRQNAALKEHGDAACAALRKQRDQEYEQLKARHRAEKDELRDRQKQGVRSPELRRRADQAPPAPEENTKPRTRADIDSMPGFANHRNEDWKLLTANQRRERIAFNVRGRELFRAIRKVLWREVREKFREDWSALHAARRAGKSRDEINALRAGIVARQKTVLDRAMDEARAAIDWEGQDQLLRQAHREERDELYRRHQYGLWLPEWLRERPSSGDRLAHTPFVHQREARPLGLAPHASFRRAAGEVAGPSARAKEPVKGKNAWLKLPKPRPQTRAENPRVRPAVNSIGDLGVGALGALADIVERLFDGFMGGVPQHAQDKQAAVTREHDEQPAAGPSAAAPSSVATDEVAQEAARLEAFWRERRSRTRDR